MAGFTTCAQPGPHGLHGRVPARCRPGPRRRPGMVPRPAHLPGGPCHHPDRRPPRPDHVPGAGARHHAPERGAGHRQRRRRGPQGGPLPDQVRRQADQDLRVGWRDVVQQRGRLPSSTRTRSWRPSSTRLTATACGWRRTPTATPASGPASGPGSTASSTGRWPPTTRSRLMAETRDLPRRHHRPGRPHGGRPHPPDPAEEGGRDLPPGPADVRQGARGRREDRLRLRRAGHPARHAGRRARSPWSTAA